MDLYSDLDGDTNSNGKHEEADAVDLYEDVLLPTGGPPPVRRQGVPGLPPSGDITGRKHQLYVGNLTWWTSDRDIADAVAGLGIRDLLDVKFFEYRPNGQSKGYCVVTFGSEQSVAMCIRGLPKTILHGNHPVVTYPTKQALMQFEASCKPRATQSNSSNQPQGNAINAAVLAPLGNAGIPPPRPPPPIGLPPPHQPPPHWHVGPHHTSRPPPSLLPPRPHAPQEPRLPSRPEWNRPPPPPGVIHPFPPQIPLHRPPPPVHPPPAPVPDNSGPRIPPPFFPRGSPHALGESLPRGPPPGYGTPPQNRPEAFQPPPTSQQREIVTGVAPPKETDYEEIMARNRTVTSSAIARAVSDAAAGEYASAIETLVMAISLIKHSDTAKDERCRVLISSLQDTLQKVESKSYGSSRKDRSRSRERERFHKRYRKDRSRSREREYRDRERDRDKDRYYYESYYRDRSRSRDKDREYREKSREDRYYEDRYRERERERDREARRESDRDRDTTRRETEREREPSRREVDRDRETTRREAERERETSRREGDREREPSRRDIEREREPSRREVERERETSRRESDKELSRRDIEEREPSSRDIEKEQSRRESDKEISRRDVSRREVDRDREPSRRDQDWDRESRRESGREPSRRESDRETERTSRRDMERDRERDKYYKIDKDDSFLRESKAV